MKKTMTLLALLLGLVFTVSGEVILSEDFRGCTVSGGTTDISGSLNSKLQTTGWTGTKLYEDAGRIRAGASSGLGSIATKTINLSSNSGNATLTVDLASWLDDGTIVKVYHAANGSNFTQVGSDIIISESIVNYTISITGGTATSKIKIAGSAASKQRFYIDNIVITQTPPPTYTLTYAYGANGSISGSTPQTVTSGNSGTAVTAVPNLGYHFVNWTINGGSGNGTVNTTANPLTIASVTGDISVTANFAEGLLGSYTVGSSGNYTSLTKADGLFKAVNTQGLAGDVTVNITSDLSEDGATALSQWTETGAGNYKLKIQSSASVLRTISGDGVNTNASLIKLDGADRVTIDGGSGKYLAFAGNSACSGIFSVVEISGSEGSSVANCNFTSNNNNNTRVYAISASSSSIDIKSNKIHSLVGATNAEIVGIGFANSTVNINNNMIVLEPGAASPVSGIFANTGSNANIYNNSIFINGVQTSTLDSYAFYMEHNSNNTLNIKNNIFYNTRAGSSAKHYAVYILSDLSPFTSNNNLFYTTGAPMCYMDADIANLADWKSATLQDANSQSSNITFEAVPLTTGELKFERAVANTSVFNTGADVGITTDFYGTARPQYGLYDIGAYELPQSSDLSETSLPTVNTLAQNYPNPFNPETTIGFTLAKNATVNLTVYNTRGEVVKSLINNSLNAGFHSVNFNAVGLNSGVYVYKLTTPDNSITKKMILLK